MPYQKKLNPRTGQIEYHWTKINRHQNESEGITPGCFCSCFGNGAPKVINEPRQKKKIETPIPEYSPSLIQKNKSVHRNAHMVQNLNDLNKKEGEKQQSKKLNSRHMSAVKPSEYIESSCRDWNNVKPVLVNEGILQPMITLPSVHSKKLIHYKGLVNIGSTCYANSALQCLLKSNIFNQAIKSNKYIQRDNIPFTLAYLDLLYSFDEQTSYPYQPRRIKELVSQRNPIFTFGQNDAIQFFSTFLYGIGEELNTCPRGIKKKPLDHSLPEGELFKATKIRDENYFHSIVEETFTGYYKTTYRCNQCSYQSSVKGTRQKNPGYDKYVLFQKFNVHYLPLPKPYRKKNKISLKDCLQQFKEPVYMQEQNAMDCDNEDCPRKTQNKSSSTTKTMQIVEANQIIAFCLKRFIDNRKDDREVEIPFQIDPRQLISSHNLEAYSGKKYKLYGVIIHVGFGSYYSHYKGNGVSSNDDYYGYSNHRGYSNSSTYNYGGSYSSLYGGHYYAYCRVKENQWIKCDDSRVTEIRESELDFKNAYGLFYQLQDEELIEIES